MKIFIIATGTTGDVHPMVGLGQRLRARGNEVQVMTSPYFEPLLDRVGLPLVPLGTRQEYEDIINNPDIWHPIKALPIAVQQCIIPALRPVYEAIREHCAGGAGVVVSHGLDFGTRIAREKLGVPMATVHLAPAFFRSAHSPPVLPPMVTSPWIPKALIHLQYWLGDVLLVDRLIGGAVNAFRAEVGLPAINRVFHRWWHSPDLIIGMFPEWFAPPQSDWPAHTVLTGFPLWDESSVTEMPEEVEDYLARGEAPILFTPGTAVPHAGQFFEAAVDACQRLGRRGILLTRHQDGLPRQLPECVRHFDYVPFSQILPRAAALVHHGGAGTLAQALCAGTPQLISPLSAATDQPDNAARLTRLGVGETLSRRRFNGRNVARALQRLLESPQVRSRCAELARRITGSDALGLTCEAVEAMTGVAVPT